MAGEHTAFFYGTLMAEEIFFSVVYGTKSPSKEIRELHTFSPAVLDEYCRHRVQYADYPAIIAEEGHSVLGIYATGLTDANMVKLDYFEGSEYKKAKVKINLADKMGTKLEGQVKDTMAYVFLYPGQLERGEWDFEEFRKNRMQIWTRGDWAYNEDDKAVE